MVWNLLSSHAALQFLLVLYLARLSQLLHMCGVVNQAPLHEVKQHIHQHCILTTSPTALF